jgi:imidazolonepropionase-like amidohydrolase
MMASLLLFTFWLTLSAAENPRGPDRYRIANARIHVGTGEVIENGVILIDGGLVVAVGAVGAVGAGKPLPPDAWRIDASGKHVYPGFIDAFGHLGLPGKKKEESAGERSEERAQKIARGPEDRPGTSTFRSAADELSLEDERISEWRNAGFTSAVTAPEDGIFPGQAAFINLAGERERDMVVKTPIALPVSLTPPGSGRSFPGSAMGVVAYVKQSFADASHYREAWTAYEAAPRGRSRPTYDRTLTPLERARSEGWPVLLPATWDHEIERVLDLAEEVGVKPVLYGVHEGYRAAEKLAKAGAPVLVSLDWPKQDKDADPDAEEPLRVLRMRDRAASTPAALEKASVRFAFFSGGLAKAEEAIAGVRKAVEAGLGRERAIRALSLDAASIYGLDDRLGSLEAGKIANLFVATGDVLEEGTTVETVFVDGTKYEVRERETAEKGEEGKK